MNDSVAVASGEAELAGSPRLHPIWRRKRWAVPVSLVALLTILTTAAWLSRAAIADSVIADTLRDYDIQATYDVEAIAPERQVVRNIVVGDPARPDLTVGRAVVHLRYRWGRPRVTRVEVQRPRLYGRWREGRVSFGTLDRFVYRATGEPPSMPQFDLVLMDARARIDTPLGPVGVKAEGHGVLADDFSAIVAATAPRLADSRCSASAVTAFGRLRLQERRPSFSGPVRFARAACSDSGVAMAGGTFGLDLRTDALFERVAGSGSLQVDSMSGADVRANGLTGTVRGAWQEGVARARYVLAARQLRHDTVTAALTTASGSVVYAAGRDDLRLDGQVQANGLRPGDAFNRLVADLAATGNDTLVEPLARQFAAALQQQARGSSASASATLRRSGGTTSIAILGGRLFGRDGRVIGRIADVRITVPPRSRAQVAGSFSMAGPGLPSLRGQLDRTSATGAVLRLALTEYRAGTSRLALPSLVAKQVPGGWQFTGEALASGAIPGGFVEGLRVPLEGFWRGGDRFALWTRCTNPSFASLRYANLTLNAAGVALCPRGGAIVQSGGSGLAVAASAPSLRVSGLLGQTPIQLSSGTAALDRSSAFLVEGVDVLLGSPNVTSRFQAAQLTGRVGQRVEGRFAGATVTLNAVPLDIEEASGAWRYADGALAIADGAFQLSDRLQPDRFTPLIAQGAVLRLANNRVLATAALRHRETGRLVTDAVVRHDIASGSGSADLAVPGLLFDPALQPADLSRLALGVVANTRGTVTGSGRIDWTPDGVTSSGAFSSDKLDFAAAFGPVRGASGTIRFDDLLGLSTAPGQTFRVASINPGIEVTDGEVALSLLNGQRLAVEGGRWPFMGGTLTMLPAKLNLGTSEVRRYDFRIEGLDAARFIERFGVSNLSATGLFDGSLSIVFDEAGNGRVEDGLLTSRAPGGNLAYVGELTYKDLSPYANFAFDALKSLDWQKMTITMKGPLAGDIVTTARFDGVSQGAGTRRNFITRRIARLPLRFVVNIQAPFARLITSLRSLYDPALVRDPRELGLLQDDGTRFVPVPPPSASDTKKPPDIHGQASETMR